MLEPCVENSIMSLVEYLDSEMAWFTSNKFTLHTRDSKPYSQAWERKLICQQTDRQASRA